MLEGMPNDDRSPLPLASANDGTYPRPQLVRTRWKDLGGHWKFAFDDDGQGVRERWHEMPRLDGSITVPFPPESSASGVHDTGFHQALWYSRVLTPDDLETAGHEKGRRLMLRFGAVDYRAVVWVNGQRVGSHEGGHTPFSFDVTEALNPEGDNELVVRVEDDPLDVAQPRGKQDWREHPHVIWYHRTSGIWQPVWLESVPRIAVEWVHWRSDLAAGRVHARVGLTAAIPGSASVDIELRHGDTVLARTTVHSEASEVEVVLTLSGQANGQAYEELLWSPEHPRLVDARIDVEHSSGVSDSVASYLGVRSAAVERRLFLLNDRPRYVRSVLSQGYWPESHLAAPSAEALRDEVQLIKDLGFNATRVHQKFEDPRFLFWADRLGLMVWAEAPATFTFTPIAVERTVREWLEVVHRDFSHPSIVTWVPLNESWGVQHIAHDDRMLSFARALVHLTKALDPTRPVVSNDGWEQADTDILAIHDYEGDGDVMRERYRDRAAVDELVTGVGPAGRRLVLSGDVSEHPVMLTEFGGISFDVHRTEDAWGYTAATSSTDFGARLRSLMTAIHASGALAGYCYTQLTDTLQETNGLVGSDRIPKLPLAEIREIMTGPRAKRPWE
jgi:beta-galactosidase/beta-glucuronidase